MHCLDALHGKSIRDPSSETFQVETRPLTLVEVTAEDGSTFSTLLQNAETVRLVGPGDAADSEVRSEPCVQVEHLRVHSVITSWDSLAAAFPSEMKHGQLEPASVRAAGRSTQSWRRVLKPI